MPLRACRCAGDEAVTAPCAGGCQELHKFWWGYAVALGAIVLLWLAKEVIDFFAVLSSNRRGADSLKVVPLSSLQRSCADSYICCLRWIRPGLICLAFLHHLVSAWNVSPAVVP